MAAAQRISLARVALFGAVTALLYVSLFVFEKQLMGLTKQGHWTFVVPIAIAFLISYFHGAFTGGFWDVLGVKAKG
jgi:hypothetical protein